MDKKTPNKPQSQPMFITFHKSNDCYSLDQPAHQYEIRQADTFPWFFLNSRNSKTSACHGSRYMANAPA